MQYFFLGSLLPPLNMGGEPPMGFEELIALYRSNLTSTDLEKVKAIRTFIDLKNVVQLLKNEPIDRRGNLSEKELDEALVNRTTLPPYLFDALDKDEKLRDFSKVLIAYFSEEYEGFLKWYFAFEHEWRILIAGYRAKKLGVDPTEELQHEDFHDPLVAQILAQKDAPFFEFPFEYADLGERLKGTEKKPEEQYEVMARYRFERVLEAIQDKPFSIDYLLGYLMQLMILEDRFALNEKRGAEGLNEIIKGNPND